MIAALYKLKILNLMDDLCSVCLQEYLGTRFTWFSTREEVGVNQWKLRLEVICWLTNKGVLCSSTDALFYSSEVLTLRASRSFYYA